MHKPTWSMTKIQQKGDQAHILPLYHRLNIISTNISSNNNTSLVNKHRTKRCKWAETPKDTTP